MSFVRIPSCGAQVRLRHSFTGAAIAVLTAPTWLSEGSMDISLIRISSCGEHRRACVSRLRARP